MNFSKLEKPLMTALLIYYVILLILTSIYAETNTSTTNSTTTTSSSGNQVIDQDFINTLVTLSPALFFLSICFKFLDLLRDALSFGGEK